MSMKLKESLTTNERGWYEVTVFSAHQPRIGYNTTTKYVFALNDAEALQVVEGLRGYKRNFGKYEPVVKRLTAKEAKFLEEIIPKYTSIDVEWAKIEGVHGTRLDSGVDLSVEIQRLLAQQEVNS